MENEQQLLTGIEATRAMCDAYLKYAAWKAGA